MRRYLPLGITVALAVAFGIALAPYLGPILRIAGWVALAVLAVLAVLFLLGQLAMVGDRANEDARKRRG